jgi:hypothetical protein
MVGYEGKHKEWHSDSPFGFEVSLNTTIHAILPNQKKKKKKGSHPSAAL